MELTKQELKLAVFAATQYSNFFCRNNQLIGYIGLVPFFLGFEVFRCPSGFVNFYDSRFYDVALQCIWVLCKYNGKLYEQLQVLRREAGGVAI